MKHLHWACRPWDWFDKLITEQETPSQIVFRRAHILRSPYLEAVSDLLLRMAGSNGVAFIVDRDGGLIEKFIGVDADPALSQLARLAHDQQSRVQTATKVEEAITVRLPTNSRIGKSFVVLSAPATDVLLLGVVVPIDRVPGVVDLFERAWNLLCCADGKVYGAHGSGSVPPPGQTGGGGQGADALAGMAAYLPRRQRKPLIG